MSSRKPGYLIGVILLALVMSAPQFVACFRIGLEVYQTRRWPALPPIPGLGETQYYVNVHTWSRLWQDQFVYVSDCQRRVDGMFDFKVSAIDPETGKTTDLGLGLCGRSHFELIVFGDRLWLVGNGESFEVVDGSLLPLTNVTRQAALGGGEGLHFLLNGEAALVEGAPHNGFCVSICKTGAWENAGDVVLPTNHGDVTFHFERGSFLTCLNQGNRIHVFLHTGRRLFHHEGLELRPVDAAKELFNGRLVSDTKPADEPVSALSVANFNGATTGWSLVREEPNNEAVTPYCHQNLFSMFVGNQPAAMILEDYQDGNPVGHLYRFDGTKWSEFATQTFPFGSNEFRTFSCRDGQKSYIVATTSMGAWQIYAVEGTGIRPTKGTASVSSEAWQWQELIRFGIVPVGTLILGIILGVGTWFLMWWYTKPDYGFGTQTVKLASLGRRGLARLIDLALIVFSTAGLGWAMTLGFDWLSLVEALNLKVDHPTIPVAARVASILALWLAFLVLSLLVVQARWGLTPGKWLCGLRTLRTTLKPCGFARSLVRETVMCVDACHFLCWTPGILSIALTDCRQRLGDLVADTLVVEVRSLSRRMPA